MKKGVFLCLIIGMFLLSGVSAYTLSVSDINSTLASVSITGATDLYSYEVNLAFTGSSYGIQQNNFLGSGAEATYGSVLKSGIITVYGSKLDESGIGVSGDKVLFNITHDGTVKLNSVYSVNSNAVGGSGSTETTIDYTPSTPVVTTGPFNLGGGGSGGGSEILAQSLGEVKISTDVDSLVFSLVAGKGGTKDLTIINNGNVSVNLIVASEGLENLVGGNKTVHLLSGGQQTIPISISPTSKGLVTGKILILFGDKIVKEIPVVVNVKSDNFLFDSSVTISDEYRVISPGQILRAQVDLREVISQEKVDVVINYVIKDFSGREYLQDSETFFVVGDKSFVKDFSTKGLPSGKYIVGIDVTYPGAFATSSAQFEIKSNVLSLETVVVWVFIVAILITCLVIIWLLRRPGLEDKHKHESKHK